MKLLRDNDKKTEGFAQSLKEITDEIENLILFSERRKTDNEDSSRKRADSESNEQENLLGTWEQQCSEKNHFDDESDDKMYENLFRDLYEEKKRELLALENEETSIKSKNLQTFHEMERVTNDCTFSWKTVHSEKLDSNLSVSSENLLVHSILSKETNDAAIEDNDNPFPIPSIPTKSKDPLSSRINIKKLSNFLNFEKDIFDTSKRVKEIKLGTEMCIVSETTKNDYCLVCCVPFTNTLNGYISHLRDTNHCILMKKLLNDHTKFILLPKIFSRLYLTHEYIATVSKVSFVCLVCKTDIVYDKLQSHLYAKIHVKRRNEMRAKTKCHFEAITMPMQCDWYNVHKYECVPCLETFDLETNFVEHLTSSNHNDCLVRENCVQNALIFDFCPTCSLLLYEYPHDYASHCNNSGHKFFLHHTDYATPELPVSAESFLCIPENRIEDEINDFDKLAAEESKDNATLIQDLTILLKSTFAGIKAYTFGLRASSLVSSGYAIDVLLGYRKIINNRAPTEKKILELMTKIYESLSENPESWELQELSTSFEMPIIKTRHTATGLACDISFEMGITELGAKCIEYFDYIFPQGHKLIIYLKQWLEYCNLLGPHHISMYALYWYIIFYLQKSSILPSIAKLYTIAEASNDIDSWRIDFTDKIFSTKKLLLGFFDFYANFDFRYDVACPLISDVIKKRQFINPQKLPDEMNAYVKYMTETDDNPEPIRIDAPMCIQDPFKLQYNITKNVSQFDLSRFRSCCAKSFDILQSC